MKRILATFSAAFMLFSGLNQVSPASAQSADEDGFSSYSSGSSDSTNGSSLYGGFMPLAVGSAAVGVVGSIAGGVLLSQSSAYAQNYQPTGSCAPEAFNSAYPQWSGSPYTRALYCDGHFAWVNKERTDWNVAFEFSGGTWKYIVPAGTTKWGMMTGCYNGIELRNRGASEEFLSRIPICTPDEIGYFW